MKKLLLLITFLFVITAGNAQTFVSGGIYSNTTWTQANSPYIVTDTVVVFPGFTLTIEPGVTVKFDNGKYLELRSAILIAQGTSTDSVTFTSNSSTPIAGIWRGIYLNTNNAGNECKFNYCKFFYAEDAIIADYQNSAVVTIKNSIFKNNVAGIGIMQGISNGYSISKYYFNNCSFFNNTYGIGTFTGNSYGNSARYDSINYCTFKNNHYGIISENSPVLNSTFTNNQTGIYARNNSIIKNCEIDSNSVQGIKGHGPGTTVSKCMLRYNNIGLNLDYTYGASTFTQNIIEYNSIGIKINSELYNIYCNKICNNTLYAMQYICPNNSNSLANNDWCTSDSLATTAVIYDGYDNAASGIVTFMPIDTSHCYLTGCNLHVTATVTNSTCDTCHNGSATAHVTYGIPPYTYTWYTSPLQTTQTATGLAPGTYTVCVFDAMGCSACNYNIYIDSTNCTGFSASAQGTNATCSTCNDGKAWVNINGGTPPYAYTWYTSPMQNTDTAIGLLPGTYGVCITDQYGCAICDSVVISTGSCSAHFNLYPDSIILHQYYAVNMASGVAPLSYLWQWGDGTTSTGPYPTHNYANAGFYAICLDITDSVGCTSHFCNSYYLQKSTNTMVIITVIPPGSIGIDETSNKLNISVYPNPATNTITFETAVNNLQLQVYNLSGQMLMEKNLKAGSNTMDVSGFPQGMYFYRLTETDKFLQSGKFIKE